MINNLPSYIKEDLTEYKKFLWYATDKLLQLNTILGDLFLDEIIKLTIYTESKYSVNLITLIKYKTEIYKSLGDNINFSSTLDKLLLLTMINYTKKSLDWIESLFQAAKNVYDLQNYQECKYYSKEIEKRINKLKFEDYSVENIELALMKLTLIEWGLKWSDREDSKNKTTVAKFLDFLSKNKNITDKKTLSKTSIDNSILPYLIDLQIKIINLRSVLLIDDYKTSMKELEDIYKLTEKKLGIYHSLKLEILTSICRLYVKMNKIDFFFKQNDKYFNLVEIIYKSDPLLFCYKILQHYNALMTIKEPQSYVIIWKGLNFVYDNYCLIFEIEPYNDTEENMIKKTNSVIFGDYYYNTAIILLAGNKNLTAYEYLQTAYFIYEKQFGVSGAKTCQVVNLIQKIKEEEDIQDL